MVQRFRGLRTIATAAGTLASVSLGVCPYSPSGLAARLLLLLLLEMTCCPLTLDSYPSDQSLSALSSGVASHQRDACAAGAY